MPLSAGRVKADGVEIQRRMLLAAVASFFALGCGNAWDELASPHAPLLGLHISIQY